MGIHSTRQTLEDVRTADAGAARAFDSETPAARQDEEEAVDSSGCEWPPLPEDDDFIPQIPWSRD
jgi:hypothetical protein